MTYDITEDLIVIARNFTAVDTKKGATLRIENNLATGSDGGFPGGPEGELAQQALDRLAKSRPYMFTPISISVISGDAYVTLAGLDTTIGELSNTMKALELAHEVSEQGPDGGVPEDGGDNNYIFGIAGKNILQDNFANIPADTPFQAVSRLLAGRIDMDDLAGFPNTLDIFEPGKYVMRRGHDWKAYDFDGLVKSAAQIYDATIEAMGYQDRSADMPDPWS